MKNRSFAPALSVLAAALFATCSSSKASAADPSGIWAKDDGSARVEIKKCGRGLCSEVVWLRNPKDSQGKPLHDARNENPSLRDRPIIGLPLFSNMRLTEPNTWVGNVYNPVEGHIYTDVKVTLVSRQQIVLRGCKTWLLCGEKTWTRSHLPTIPAGTEMPIEVKATVLPGSTDKAEPTSMPKPKTPVVEAFREREPPSAPGFAFVSTRVSWEPLPLSGGNVSSMIAMTRPSVVATTAAPSLTETTTAGEQRPWLQRRSMHLAASRIEAEAGSAAPNFAKPEPKPDAIETQEQRPWLQRRSVHLVASRTEAEAGSAVPSFAKPEPKPDAIEAQERWPWLQRRSRTGVQAEAPAPAPSFVKSRPKPIVREAQEQWPWLQRRSVLLASSRTGG
jgi:uncharacterized protein (DUF2147 family)